MNQVAYDQFGGTLFTPMDQILAQFDPALSIATRHVLPPRFEDALPAAMNQIAAQGNITWARSGGGPAPLDYIGNLRCRAII
jgi:hypothetical protein